MIQREDYQSRCGVREIPPDELWLVEMGAVLLAWLRKNEGRHLR